MIQMLAEFIQAIPFPSWMSDTVVELGPISIKWYGLGYVFGAFGAYLYAVRTSAKNELWKPTKTATALARIPDTKMLEDFLFFCFLGIFIGGRLGYVLFYGMPEYLETPLRILKVWEGGMSFHGGFLGVAVATIYMARSRKIPLFRVADMAAIGAPIGLF